MERVTRLIVLLSMLLAGTAYAWLAGLVVPALPWAAAAAFAISFALASISLPLALIPSLLFAYTAPAALMIGFGTADYHQILVWLAALAGPIVRASDWSRWHLPPVWKWPLVAWALVLAVTWPIVAGREVDFSLAAARTLDTPNGLLSGPPPLVAAWVVSVALGQLIGLLWLDLLWARFGHDRLRRAERVVLLPLLASAVIAAAAGLYQRYGDISWLNPGNWPSLGRAGGLMLDANSFGVAVAMWASAAAALAWRLRRPLWLGALFGAVLAAGMWTSGSRTALLTTVAGGIAVGVAAGARTRAWQLRLTPVILLLAAGVIVVTAALQTEDRSNPLTRLIDTVPRAEEGGLRRLGEELWARNGYGLAAMRAIADHPWSGIGIGAFNPLSSDYSYLTTGALIPPDNAQNWWRHQIVELGLLGSAPSLLFSLVLLLLIWKGEATGDQRAAATVVRGVLTGLGLASLVGLPTQHPALWLTFVTFLYWLGALVDTPPTPMRPVWSVRAAWITVVVLALVVAGLQAASARGDLRVPMRALRAGFPYGYGFSADEAPQDEQVRWASRRAVAVVEAEHAYFDLTARAPHADPANPVRVRLWRGSRLMADVEVRGDDPVRRLVRVPPGQKFLMIETAVSHAAADGRGLRIIGRWLREVPPDTRPDIIVP